MLPGKKYTPEDIIRILLSRVWWVLVPMALTSALAAIYGYMLPDRYRSEALIQVVPQRVPESYVQNTVTTRIEDRLEAIKQQILSRTRLEQIIEEFNLYPEERRTGILEDVVQKMRTTDVAVDILLNRGDAFRVSYIGRDPRVVTRVTGRLASLFIEESLLDRQVLAEGTSQFLEAQLQDARRNLETQEKKLELYRKQYSGELPSQQESNVQQIQNLQTQIQTLAISMDRDQERRQTLERQLVELESPSAALSALPSATPPAGTSSSALTGTTAQQLASARVQFDDLSIRYRSGHPDLEASRRLVRDLERKFDEELKATPPGGPAASARVSSPAEIDRHRRAEDLRLQIAELDAVVTRKRLDERHLRDQVVEYQRKVEMVPTRESELTALTRDYNTYTGLYQSLLANREQSRISENLEMRQIGEQFKLLDPARIPERPFSPNRLQINLVGLALGLGLGLALVAFIEYRESGFKTDEDVRSILNLPVLAVVPLMRSELEGVQIRRRRLLINLAFGCAVVGCLAVVVYASLFAR